MHGHTFMEHTQGYKVVPSFKNVGMCNMKFYQIVQTIPQRETRIDIFENDYTENSIWN